MVQTDPNPNENGRLGIHHSGSGCEEFGERIHQIHWWRSTPKPLNTVTINHLQPFCDL